MNYSNGMMFSTKSHDNDVNSQANCADMFTPWWHKSCSRAALFGIIGEYPAIRKRKGIKWEYNWGKRKFAKNVVMMIRQN